MRIQDMSPAKINRILRLRAIGMGLDPDLIIRSMEEIEELRRLAQARECPYPSPAEMVLANAEKVRKIVLGPTSSEKTLFSNFYEACCNFCRESAHREQGGA